MAEDSIAMQDIFVFERTGIDESGKVRGMFRATGTRPQFAERLATSGARLRFCLVRIEDGDLKTKDPGL